MVFELADLKDLMDLKTVVTKDNKMVDQKVLKLVVELVFL